MELVRSREGVDMSSHAASRAGSHRRSFGKTPAGGSVHFRRLRRLRQTGCASETLRGTALLPYISSRRARNEAHRSGKRRREAGGGDSVLPRAGQALAGGHPLAHGRRRREAQRHGVRRGGAARAPPSRRRGAPLSDGALRRPGGGGRSVGGAAGVRRVRRCRGEGAVHAHAVCGGAAVTAAAAGCCCWKCGADRCPAATTTVPVVAAQGPFAGVSSAAGGLALASGGRPHAAGSQGCTLALEKKRAGGGLGFLQLAAVQVGRNRVC